MRHVVNDFKIFCLIKMIQGVAIHSTFIVDVLTICQPCGYMGKRPALTRAGERTADPFFPTFSESPSG
jgi:hypothetical protein